MYLEQCGGGGNAGVDIEFHKDGTVTVYAAQQDNGQAHRTTLTQIFSSSLGYDAGLIKIVQGDSLRTPQEPQVVLGCQLFWVPLLCKALV